MNFISGRRAIKRANCRETTLITKSRVAPLASLLLSFRSLCASRNAARDRRHFNNCLVIRSYRICREFNIILPLVVVQELLFTGTGSERIVKSVEYAV